MKRSPDPSGAAYREYAGRREMTLEERLADERIVFLWGEIGPGNAGGLIMRLFELADKQPKTTMETFVKALRGEKVEHATFADGIAAQRCLTAIAESIRRKAWTKV